MTTKGWPYKLSDTDLPDFGRTLHPWRVKKRSLASISKELGGSPSESYLWRVENGQAPPSAKLAASLAHVLGLPEDVLVNAAGFATQAQRRAAFEELRKIVGEPEPVEVRLDELDADAPDHAPVGHSKQFLPGPVDGFVVRLRGESNKPYVGLAVVVRGAAPRDGQGVVIEQGGRLSAWKFTREGQEAWLTNGADERVPVQDAGVQGAIVRVIQDFE